MKSKTQSPHPAHASDAVVLSPIVGRPKRPLVIEALTQLAIKIGPGGKFPRLADLSSGLGVAVGTLDQCLLTLSERGLIHRRRGSGIYVASGVAKKRVALVFGANVFSSNGFIYALLLKHCQQYALSHNHRFSFYLDVSTPEGASEVVPDICPLHEDLADALENRQIDGVVLVACQSEHQAAWIRSRGVPVVCLFGVPKEPAFITFDYEDMIRKGLKALSVEGCRTVGFIGQFKEGAEFFQETTTHFGLTTRSSWVIHPARQGLIPEELSRKLGQECALELLLKNGWVPKRGTPPDLPEGLVIADDMLTRGLCIFLKRLGFQIGKDIKIATHTNKGSFALEEWQEKILPIEVDPEEMVSALFSSLETLMAGRELDPPIVKVGSKSPLDSER